MKNRILKDINVAYFMLPLVLFPLFFEWLLHLYKINFFVLHKEGFLFADIAYIVLLSMDIKIKAIVIKMVLSNYP